MKRHFQFVGMEKVGKNEKIRDEATQQSSSSSTTIDKNQHQSRSRPINNEEVSLRGYNSNYIQVKESQRGNPVLDCIKNVNWQYNSSIIPDYVMGTTCALFISVRYHMLHPNYLYRRIKEVGSDFRLRIVLCQVDVEDNVKALLELNKLCFTHRFTLILSWSALEAGRYLETFKSYENKPSTSIQERVETDFLPQVTNVLKSVKSINRTDVVTLFEAFRNFQGICAADESQLLLCPGLGEKKVKRLYSALHTPFKKSKHHHPPQNTASVPSISDLVSDNVDV